MGQRLAVSAAPHAIEEKFENLSPLAPAHLSCAHPAPYRGVSVQHLQMRGGERWPGNDVVSEIRHHGPAVEAAAVPARQPRATALFGQSGG
jgi:hypothetical protein